MTARTSSALDNSNKQISLLLKEVHHRVRNNLQLLVSILNMQERQSDSEEAKLALNAFRQRILGLSAVYERIYQADDLSQHLSADLIKDVIAAFLRFENLSSRQIDVQVDDTTLSQDKAVHLALFIAEALAYFSQTRDQLSVEVDLSSDPGGRCQLSMVNEGAACPSGTAALSERLLHAFATQLGGALSLDTTPKTAAITLSFDPDD